MQFSLLPLATVLVAAFTAQAHAWNSAGHQVIDLIAWQQLSEENQAAAVSLLRDHPRFEQHFLENVPDNVWKASQGERNQWVFAFAGTWPDLVRSARGRGVTPEDVQRFNRPQWHYVNLYVFLSPEDGSALAGAINNNRETEPPAEHDDPSMNVVQAIATSLEVVRDEKASRADRAVALCWFLHLAADAHQPCHSSALYSRQRFPEGDRGGNSIPVHGPGGNLHALWDYSILPLRADYNRIRKEAVELSQSGSEIEAVEHKQWLVESWKLAKTDVYTAEVLEAVAAAEDRPEEHLERVELPADYFRNAGLLSKQRAAVAGSRIATALADVLPSTIDLIAEEAKREKRNQQAVDFLSAAGSMLRPSKQAPPDKAPEAERPDARYWINTKSGARHNESCRWFGNTKAGRYCSKSEGHACGQCGG